MFEFTKAGTTTELDDLASKFMGSDSMRVDVLNSAQGVASQLTGPNKE